MAALQRADDPGAAAPDVPWAAVVERGPGTFAVAASTMLPSGIFWADEHATLHAATDPGQVAAALSEPPPLDDGFLQGYSVSDVAVDRTPFRGVRRVPGGSTLVWSGGVGVTRQWCGAETWPQRPEGIDIREYRLAVADVTADLAARTTPVVAAVSGGLDSTFLAAALARAGAAPVQGLIHCPLPAAGLAPVGRFDPDESALAAALAGAYPDRLSITRVENTDHVRPLDAARPRAAQTWWPVYNPANAPWLAAMAQLAQEAGTTMLFVGTNGNAAFSHSPPRSGRWRPRVRSQGVLRPEAIIGAPYRRPRRVARGRAAHLAWLGATDNGLTASLNPGGGVLRVDPFRSRRILDLAARITDDQWHAGGLQRGFAREAMAGWVPDAIRLRTRRGAQGWDAWYVSRHDRRRFLAEVDLLADTPGLAGWVDGDLIRESVAAWPWGTPTLPPRMEFTVVLRLLALAAFARDMAERLARHRLDVSERTRWSC